MCRDMAPESPAHAAQVYAARHALPPAAEVSAWCIDTVDAVQRFKRALRAYPAPSAQGTLREIAAMRPADRPDADT